MSLRIHYTTPQRDVASPTITEYSILRELGLTSIRLLSNNPEKRRQLEEHGITVDGLVPLVVGVSAQNAGYLDTKRDRMGHQLPAHLEAGAAN